MTTLYEISAKYRSLDQLDIDDETFNDTLESVDAEFNEKAENIAFVILNCNSTIAAIDDEIARLTQRKKVLNNKKDRLDDYLKTNMEALGKSKIPFDLFNITHRAPREIVQVNDSSLIPDDFIDIKVTESPMKKEIKKALDAGDEVPGCSLTKGESSLIIK